MHDKASELCIEFLETYCYKHYELSDHKRRKKEPQYDPKYLFLDGDDYSVWSGKEE